MGCITNDNTLQAALPQVLLPNSPTGKVPAHEELLYEELEPPTVVWHGTNGWVNDHVMMKWFHLLQRTVRREKGAEVEIVLLLDSASQHLSRDVLAVAARLQLTLLFIPSCLTWLLQPLDVCVFKNFKEQFAKLMLQEKLRQPNGALPKNAWIRLIRVLISRELVNRPWGEAFARVGLADNLDALTSKIQDHWPAIEEQVPAIPTLEEMDIVYGRHRVPTIRDLIFSRSRIVAEQQAALAPGPVPGIAN